MAWLSVLLMTLLIVPFHPALPHLTQESSQKQSPAKTPAKQKTEKPKKSQAELEAAFARFLTGANLVGTFTIDGSEKGMVPKPERYEIAETKKLPNGKWQITARVKYGKIDVKMPFQLDVVWAGDTPVITGDHFSILGMGDFSFRVLFHGKRYVGTWEHHGRGGGHMFGRVEPASAKKKTDEKRPGQND